GAGADPSAAVARELDDGGVARRGRCPQGVAARVSVAPGRVRHAVGLGVQPGVGVTLPAGCATGAHDHRRGDDPGAGAQPPTRPTTHVNDPSPLATGLALQLSGVSKSFRETRALIDVSLDVTDGELLAVVGPSGCGKSTLLRIVAGLIAADRGSVWIG